MIDVDDAVRRELDRLVVIDPRSDWDEVLTRASRRPRHWPRRLAFAVATVLAAAALAVVTPLGPAIAQTLGDFSAWLTGQPGSAVSGEEQREFEAENASSWLGFPQGTQLRRLITKRVGAATVELLGFRSGASTLCLRLTVRGETNASTLECAPLAELLREGGPARVVIADHTIGKGDKVAWYGTDRFHSAQLQLTSGIVTDDVEGVVLEDDGGRHEVPTAGNAFLYVAEQPEVGQRVKRVWARTSDGLVPVPFVPKPFGLGGGGFGPPAGAAPTAPAIERELSGGRIAWLENHELRGESLDVLPQRMESIVRGRSPSNVVFGRVLAPDPDRPVRIAVTLNAHRPGGPPAGVCTWFVGRSGGAGGCSPYPDVFERTLIPFGLSGGGSGAFMTVEGTATDDVAAIEAILRDGQRVKVPLGDNAFVVDLPRAKLPALLVARDPDDRVIEVSDALNDMGGGGPSPAKGQATSLLRVSGPDGSRAELLVGPATGGGECMFVKHFLDRRHTGRTASCNSPTWTGEPVQITSIMQPPRFVTGRVRSDVASVRIRFGNGRSTTVAPTRGYVLWVDPRKTLEPEKAAVAVEGLDEHGEVVGRVSLRPPKR